MKCNSEVIILLSEKIYFEGLQKKKNTSPFQQYAIFIDEYFNDKKSKIYSPKIELVTKKNMHHHFSHM